MGNIPYKRPLTLVPKQAHLYTGVKLGFFKWYAQNSKSTQSGLPNCFHVGDFYKFLFSWCLTFDKVIISLGLALQLLPFFIWLLFTFCSLVLLFSCFFFLYKGNKGRCKESTIRGHRKKIWAPDGIQTHDPPCSRSDALTSELLKTRWRARVVFAGWTTEPHLTVTQSITSNTLRLNCITQSH